MTGRAAELGAQYATVEEILEQPSPLPQRLQQLCRHLCDQTWNVLTRSAGRSHDRRMDMRRGVAA